MKLPNYPSPCLKCKRIPAGKECSQYTHCREWKTWVNWWWKYFRRAFGQPGNHNAGPGDKFRYEHPDIIRQELKKNPCDTCCLMENCYLPCQAYYDRYNAIRRAAGSRMGMLGKDGV